MEEFTEEHAKHLLNNEWLVKADPSKAIPYLFKFHSSVGDLSCCILVTDTKSVWVEGISISPPGKLHLTDIPVLNSKHLARRWRTCNSQSPEPFEKIDDEDVWRERTLSLLSKGHTMGGMTEITFEGVESKYSDFAFELECEAFKWRWETCFLGYQRSSEIISKHLIFPLMSLNHLTFSSAQSISDLSDADLETSVDKLSRTARRTIDNHIKNAISKPRVATSIRRVTAMFNFIPDLKPITSIVEKPLLEVEKLDVVEVHKSHSPPPRQQEANSSPRREKYSPKKIEQKRERSVDIKGAQPDSETESDNEPADTKKTIGASILAGPQRISEQSSSNGISKDPTPPPVFTQKSRSRSVSNAEASPLRPAKKTKPTVKSSSDNDSDQNTKKSRSGSAAAGSGARRGTRQPIKRGGKRF
ncbi:hypothetical protein CVT25_006062 [Psilocybe cyanescens]|uniref:Uncharacterized protein n=1 Tax=Psilocybe cyanescens TaxID=93625 RepID=A0A409VMM8_PSICY|nr:hypothetical protein CVT25_006062 [Psilocybe cyanescens]